MVIRELKVRSGHQIKRWTASYEIVSMNNQRWNNGAVDRNEQRRLKRRAAMAAGAKLFAEKGYEKTSLEDIAAALNITKRSLYYYFKGKDDILFECHKQALSIAEEIVDRSLDRSVPVLDRIASVVGEYSDWINSNYGACLVLIHEGAMTEDCNKVLRSAKARLDGRMRELITEGITDGTIRDCDPKLAAAAIFGSLNWIPFWNRSSVAERTSTIKREFGAFIDNALRKH